MTPQNHLPGDAFDAVSVWLGRGLLIVAMFSAVALMSRVWTAGPLVLDEHVSYWIVQSNLPGSVTQRSLNWAATPPLSSWIQQAFISNFGKSETVFRCSSVIFFWLAILTIYPLGRDLGGPVVGGLSALVLAWHPTVLDEVRIARCYGLLVWLSVLLIWAAIRWQRRPDSLLYALGGACAATGLIWTHYTSAPLATLCFVAMASSLIRSRGSFKQWRNLLMAALLVAVFSLPLLPTLFRMWEWSPFLNFQQNPSPPWEIIGSLWWFGIPLGWLTAWLVTQGMVFLGQSSFDTPSLETKAPKRGNQTVSPGSHRNHPKTPNEIWMLILWSLIPLLMLVVVARGDRACLGNPRYQIAFAIPGSCLIANILARRRPGLAATIGCVAALTATWVISGRSPLEPHRLRDPGASHWQLMAEIIQREGDDGQPVFAQSGLVESTLVPAFFEDRQFLEYVACRISQFYLDRPCPRYGLPFNWNSSPDMRRNFADILINARSRGVTTAWLAGAIDTDLNRMSISGFESILREQGYVIAGEWNTPFAILKRFEQGVPVH
jgi:Dolichyl-phosphate-mannose-protein mannosyltransferase